MKTVCLPLEILIVGGTGSEDVTCNSHSDRDPVTCVTCVSMKLLDGELCILTHMFSIDLFVIIIGVLRVWH